MFTQKAARPGSILRPVAFGLVASVVLFSTATSAFAGVKEIAAITAKLSSLAPGKTFDTASASELVQAYSATIADSANKALKPGIIAGEILRLAKADVGGPLGDVIALTAAKTTIATDAIKTATTGKAPKTDNVPTFSSKIATTQTDAIALALLVKSSKTGVGATLAGFALSLGDTQKAAFENAVFVDTKGKALSADALEISQFISKQTASGATFAQTVAGTAANSKFADKIITGVAAGKPTEAGAVTGVALNLADPLKPANLLLAAKAAALAKSIAAVADIEQIQKVGEQIALKIGAGKIKLTQTAAIATTLGKAIIAKLPLSSLTEAQTSITSRNDNKVDELGELAAYMLNAVSTNADFLKVDGKNANKLVLGLIKAIVTSAKTKTPPGTGPAATDVLSYVAGSVALTMQSLLTGAAGGSPLATVANLVLTTLKDPVKMKPIAALAKVDANTFLTGPTGVITIAIAGNTSRFENGTIALTNGVGGVGLTDPETNTRNF